MDMLLHCLTQKLLKHFSPLTLAATNVCKHLQFSNSAIRQRGLGGWHEEHTIKTSRFQQETSRLPHYLQTSSLHNQYPSPPPTFITDAFTQVFMVVYNFRIGLMLQVLGVI